MMGVDKMRRILSRILARDRCSINANYSSSLFPPYLPFHQVDASEFKLTGSFTFLPL